MMMILKLILVTMKVVLNLVNLKSMKIEVVFKRLCVLMIPYPMCGFFLKFEYIPLRAG